MVLMILLFHTVGCGEVFSDTLVMHMIVWLYSVTKDGSHGIWHGK